MKKVIITVLVAVLSTSCVFNFNVGNGKHQVVCKGDVIEKTLPLPGFQGIRVNGSSDIDLVQGDSCRVIVRACEEVFDYIDYKVNNDILVIENKDNVNIKAETFDVTVVIPKLIVMTVNGSADVEFKGGYISSEGLEITVNGAGDLELDGVRVPRLVVAGNGAIDIEARNIDVNELSLDIHGAGDAVISGTAASASFSVSGAGDVDARGLDCGNVSTRKSGVASIRLK